MTLWSIVAAAQAALQGEQSFYACRALLGLLEVGPDTNPASGDRLTRTRAASFQTLFCGYHTFTQVASFRSG